jgi:hypothetical protein
MWTGWIKINLEIATKGGTGQGTAPNHSTRPDEKFNPEKLLQFDPVLQNVALVRGDECYASLLESGVNVKCVPPVAA